MSRFEKLRVVEKAREQREAAFWESLESAVSSTYKAFAEYLQLPSATFESDGKHEHYVKLGTKTADGFEEKRSFELGGVDGRVEFDLGVVVDRAQNSFPKSRYVIRCSAQYQDGALAVVVGSGGSEESCILITDPESFEKIASEIYSQLESFIKNQYT